jgi:hypothetical protein
MSTSTISSFTVTFVLPSQSPTHKIGVAGAVSVAVALGWPVDEVVDGVAVAVLLGVGMVVAVPLAGTVTAVDGVTVAHEQHAKGGPPLCGRQIASGPHCGF